MDACFGTACKSLQTGRPRFGTECESMFVFIASGELGHQFHVMDEEAVLLSLDHPFASERRFASLLVRDNALAESLTAGFEGLWQQALKNLREVRLLPRRDSVSSPPT